MTTRCIAICREGMVSCEVGQAAGLSPMLIDYAASVEDIASIQWCFAQMGSSETWACAQMGCIPTMEWNRMKVCFLHLTEVRV